MTSGMRSLRGMERVKGIEIRTRGQVLGLFLGTCVLACELMAASPVGAAEFDSPPTVGNRRVALSWDADPDDPIFNGNTVLVPETTFSMIHGPGHVVREISLVGSADNPLGVSFATGETALQLWNGRTGQVTQSLPLGSTAEPADLSVHRSGRWAIGALPTGEVELWNLSSGTAPTFARASSRPLTQVQFFPGVNDPNDLRHVTAGLNDTVRVWRAPGEQLYAFRIVDGRTHAIAINRAGTRVLTGGRGGTIRAWTLSSQPFSPEFLVRGHDATIAELRISPDGRRYASADSAGIVKLWPFGPAQNPIATIETPPMASPPKLLFSIPDGAILFIGLADGTLQIHDGGTGAFLREAQVSAEGIESMAISPSGTRVFTGARSGMVFQTRAGRCIPSVDNPICFGGYKIWRNTQPDTSGIELMRVYGFGDSTWSFQGVIREFVDPDSVIIRVGPPSDNDDPVVDQPVIAGPHNGVPYFYSLTRFNRHFLNGSVFDVLTRSIHQGFYRDPGSVDPTPIVPQSRGRSDLPLLGEIFVVPNPYERGKVPWDATAGEHVEFRNLPPEATIRLYSVAGDLVRVLEHGAGRYGESRDTQEWDLRNSSDEEVAPGVYVYQIETPSGEVIQGYLAIIT